MKIKKYNTQQKTASLNDRLDLYQQQAEGYRLSRKGKPGLMKNALRGSLTALIPLAAAAAANAQCQGAQGSFVLANNAQAFLDVDGDGYTNFTFRNNTGLYLSLKGTSSNSFALFNTAVVKRFGAGVAINASSYFLGSFVHLCNSSGGGSSQFNVGHTVPAFIGIKKPGNVFGFIQIVVSDCSGNDMAYSIPEMGYENDGNSAVTTGDCGTLPVEMLFFRTAAQDKNIQLEWATATEHNNDGFEIQRSIDGRRFMKIGWVEGHGSTNEKQEYSFTDKTAQPNTTYYYQLKQIDSDGSEEFSPVRSAMVKDGNRVDVSEFMPNVVSKNYGGSWLTVKLPEAADADITFFDGRGVAVKNEQRHLDEGRNKFVLHVEDLPAGNYFVKIQMGREMVYRKLILR